MSLWHSRGEVHFRPLEGRDGRGSVGRSVMMLGRVNARVGVCGVMEKVRLVIWKRWARAVGMVYGGRAVDS